MNPINRDNVYVNCTITNNSQLISIEGLPTTLSDNFSNASFNIVKSQPILQSPYLYYMSIIRADIPLLNIPICVFPVIYGNTGNPNLSPLVIGIKYLGTYYPVNIVYTPEDLTQTPPVQINPNKQIITPYYFVYTYNHIIQLLNIALNQAYINAGSPSGILSPYLYYNASNPNTSVNLVVPQAFVNDGAEIFINSWTLNYLNSFTYSFYGVNQPYGADYIFNLTYVTPEDSYTVNGNSNTFYRYQSQFSPLQYFSNIKKVVIVCDGMPLNYESVPAFDSSNDNQNSYSNFSNIALDIDLTFQSPEDAVGILHFSPYVYKLIDLVSLDPMYKLNVSVYFQDSLNNLYPIQLNPYSSINIKIAFFKKSLFGSSYLLNKV